MRPVLWAAGGLALCSALAAPALAHDLKQVAWVSAKLIKQRDADRALRETLARAAEAAAVQLGKPGAFSNDPARAVPLPGSLGSLAGDWNPVGRSGALEQLQRAMNLAAETSAPAALPIFTQAISDINFADAVAIVRSGDEAATQFLAVRTRGQVEAQLRPVVEAALNQAGAFAALSVAGAASGSPQHIGGYRNTIIDTTVSREVDAWFAAMRAEERDIRADPAARGLPQLRDVFGAAAPVSAGG